MARQTMFHRREAEKKVFRTAEREMESEHRVKSLEYELKLCTEGRMERGLEAKVALKRVGFGKDVGMKFVLKMGWSWGVMGRK